MTYEEALDWLNGQRSGCNWMPQTEDDWTRHHVATAQYDAAMTQQAYWIVKAHIDGLVKRQGDDPSGLSATIDRCINQTKVGEP